MLRHIVFFTARTEADRKAVEDGLQALKTIPHSKTFEISRNLRVDLYGNDIDIVVYAEFENEEALKAYKAHPTYAETTAKVRPLRELRFAADVSASEP